MSPEIIFLSKRQKKRKKASRKTTFNQPPNLENEFEKSYDVIKSELRCQGKMVIF